MKFHVGPIPEDQSFLVDQAWRPLKEPSPVLAQVLSLPIAVAAAGAIFALILLTSGHLAGPPTLWLLPVIAILFPLHELVHLLFHPLQGRSPQSLAGFWPKMLLFYAHWPAAWSKRKFVRCLLAPFFFISVVPVLIAAWTGYGGPTLGWLAIVNAVASSVDLLGVLLLLQVPASASLRNAGWKTYWKPACPAAEPLASAPDPLQ